MKHKIILTLVLGMGLAFQPTSASAMTCASSTGPVGDWALSCVQTTTCCLVPYAGLKCKTTTTSTTAGFESICSMM